MINLAKLTGRIIGEIIVAPITIGEKAIEALEEIVETIDKKVVGDDHEK